MDSKLASEQYLASAGVSFGAVPVNRSIHSTIGSSWYTSLRAADSPMIGDGAALDVRGRQRVLGLTPAK